MRNHLTGISIRGAFVGFLAISLFGLGLAAAQGPKVGEKNGKGSKADAKSVAPQTAVFAAGCFWSVETDFERAPGVLDVIAGYTGGKTKNPTYKTYSSGGHREAVQITYDPKEITFAGLVEFLIKHSNPIDKGGSFIDRGTNYTAAIYYASDEEKKIAEDVIKKIDALKVYRTAITIPVIKRGMFYPAEVYHQDYHSKNPLDYASYRSGCGRDEFIFKHWGTKADFLTLAGSFPAIDEEADDEKNVELFKTWASFKKPTAVALKKKLTKEQYQVTQELVTEKPFANDLWKEKGDGIYVDVVSGEPLFSSRDKIEGKDGWPAFSKPIAAGAVKSLKVGTKEFAYIEVRSQFAASYLGRLLITTTGTDAEETRRFGINGAALRFISLDKMAAEGYGEFLSFVKPEK